MLMRELFAVTDFVVEYLLVFCLVSIRFVVSFHVSNFCGVGARSESSGNSGDFIVVGVVIPLITLHAKLSGAVYCNRSCLFLFVCLFVCAFVCLWVCYHDNSKLRASIFTELGL